MGVKVGIESANIALSSEKFKKKDEGQESGGCAC